MTHKIPAIALPMMLALVASSASATRIYNHSGIACAATGGQENCLDRNQYGTGDTCSSVVTVECPIETSVNTTGAPAGTSFGIMAYDRSSTDVNCDLQRVDANGNITFTTNITTNGNQPGVQGPTVSFNTTLQGAWRLRCALPAPSSSGYSHLVSYQFVTNEP